MKKNATEKKLMKIFVTGLPEHEHRILQATAKISHTRNFALVLVNEGEARKAAVILIDASDSQALSWAEHNKSWLDRKTVIWIDSDNDNPNHATLHRPVIWVNLPITISRILDDIDVRQLSRIEHPASEPLSTTPLTPRNTSVAEILVCDDSKAVRNYLATFLKKQGYAVTCVENGEDAIEAAKNHVFACVLMDILMPGIDGYRACREIGRIKHDKKIPVIMLTSKSSPFDKIRGKISGCKAYLTKPVTQSALLNAVVQHAQSDQ